MNSPIFPFWLSPLILGIAIILIAAYILLSVRMKTERCAHCKFENPVEALACSKCGESLIIERFSWHNLLLALAAVMAIAPFILLVLSARNYIDPPVPELIIAGVGFIVLIAAIPAKLWITGRRISLKKRATVARTNFYGGYCAKCGTEILGGVEKCPKCGWKVNAEKPNWAIAAKNGKTGRPVVEMKVTCYKCKAENPPTALRCQKCKADLLKYKPVWIPYCTLSSAFCSAWEQDGL